MNYTADIDLTAQANTDEALDLSELDLTPSQARALQDLRVSLADIQAHGFPAEHEFKMFKVAQSALEGRARPLTFVTVEYGRIGDEDTMLSIVGRDHRHFHIGTRGGLRLLNAAKESDARGRSALYCATK